MRFSNLPVLNKYCLTSSYLTYSHLMCPSFFAKIQFRRIEQYIAAEGNKTFTLWFLAKLLNFILLSFLFLSSPEGS